MNIILLSSFFIYLFVLCFIGSLFYTRTKNASSYMLGDRQVNYYVTAIATQASDMGGWLFLGFPAAIYLRGLPEVWSAIGLASCMFFTWQFIATKLRKASEKSSSETLSTFLSRRFDDTNHYINLISCIISLYFFIYYIAAGLVGLGILFEATFDISYITGLILGITAALLYTLIGGFLAVAWTDFFQGIFLLLAIIIVPLIAFSTIGIKPILMSAKQHGIPLSLFSKDQSILGSLALALGWGLGYLGQPHILTNFMGIDNPNRINHAKYIGMGWLIIGLIASASIGIVSIGFTPYSLDQANDLFITMATTLFPSFIAGFALCGVIAATLSTMDSHILLAGSSIGNYIKTRKKAWKLHKYIVTISRATSILVAIIALFIASNYHSASAVYYLTNYAWSGLGSTFGPTILCSLYISWTSRKAIFVGMLSGGLISATWGYFNTNILPLIPGFSIGLGVILLISLFTTNRKPS